MFKKKVLIILIIFMLISFEKTYIKYNKTIIEKNKIEYTLNNKTNYRVKKDLYDGILIIPKIKLKKGIYKKEDKRNNIEENIMIHNSSTYPNIDKSNLILIAHSGSGEKAYFKDLNKLDTDSLIEFYYDNIKYVYKIADIYKVDKTGQVNIKRNQEKKTITLITCDMKDKTKQIIYIGYILDEISY